MDITRFVFNGRERALQVGDYDSYRSRLSRQLLSLRRQLGQATPSKSKYTSKAPVSSQDIVDNNAFVHIFLIQAERAWARAMHIKSVHAETHADRPISGATRRYIISRLHKATNYAHRLLVVLSDKSVGKFSDRTFLEAQAYSLYLTGAMNLENQSSKAVSAESNAHKPALDVSLAPFSEAYIIYAALYSSTRKDIFRDVLIGTLEPNMRVAAYRSHIDRTVPIPTVAKRSFRPSQTELRATIVKFNANAFNESTSLISSSTSSKESAKAQTIPTTISWRGREAPIVDAAIGQALSLTSEASSKLQAIFSALSNAEVKPQRGNRSSNSSQSNDPASLAAAYDPVLTSAQDTVDAVRRAITDLQREGVPESDSRMQDLRVSDLAANFSLIQYRVGRNRVLMADSYLKDDGITLQSPDIKRSAKRKNAIIRKPALLRVLRERAVLYDTTLQSLESIVSLRGASSSADFLHEIDQKKSYFQSLKCLTIGRSHDAIGSRKEALALFDRALNILLDGYPDLSSSSLSRPSADKDGDVSMDQSHSLKFAPPTLDILSEQLERALYTLKLNVHRYRGLVTLEQIFPFPPTKIRANAELSTPSEAKDNKITPQSYKAPLISRLDEFPILLSEDASQTNNDTAAAFGGSQTLSLNNLVTYPPKLQPVPVKPIFLDIAWNYIDYPGRDNSARDSLTSVAVDTAAAAAVSAAKVGGKIADAIGVSANAGGEQGENNEGAANSLAEDEEEAVATAAAPPAKKRGWFGFGRS